MFKVTEEVTQGDSVDSSQPRLKFVFLISLFWVWIAFGFLSSLTGLLSDYLGGAFTASSLISFLVNIPFIALFSFLYAGETSVNPVMIGFQAFLVTILLPAIIATFLGFLTFRYRRLIPFLLFILPLLFFLGAILRYDLSLLLTFVPATTFVWIAKRNKPEETKKIFKTGLWIGIRVFAAAAAVIILSSVLGNFAHAQGELRKIAKIKQEGTFTFLRPTYLPSGVNKLKEYETGGSIGEDFSCGSHRYKYNTGPFRIYQGPLTDKLDGGLYNDLEPGKLDNRTGIKAYAEIIINNNQGIYLYSERESSLVWKTNNSIIRIDSEEVCGNSKEELIKIAQSMQP